MTVIVMMTMMTMTTMDASVVICVYRDSGRLCEKGIRAN